MTAEEILEVLSKQSFANFYNGEDSPFTKFISGDDRALSKAEMLDKIRHLFGTK